MAQKTLLFVLFFRLILVLSSVRKNYEYDGAVGYSAIYPEKDASE